MHELNVNFNSPKDLLFISRGIAENVNFHLVYLKRSEGIPASYSQGLNMEAVSRALELDFTEWKLEKEAKGEEVSAEQYMEEQFGLPEGLSVMDVITRSS